MALILKVVGWLFVAIGLLLGVVVVVLAITAGGIDETGAVALICMPVFTGGVLIGVGILADMRRPKE